MTTADIEAAKKLVDEWLEHSEPGVADAYVTLRDAIAAALTAARDDGVRQAAEIVTKMNEDWWLRDSREGLTSLDELHSRILALLQPKGADSHE